MGSRRDPGSLLRPDGRSSSACRAPRNTLSANSNDRGGVASAVAPRSLVPVRNVKDVPWHVPDAPPADPRRTAEDYQLTYIATFGGAVSPRNRCGSRSTRAVSLVEKCDRSVLVSPKQSAPRLTAVRSPHSAFAPSRRWC